MLNRIPREVFLKISDLLRLQDKLTLIATCQHFFNLMSCTNLYSELDLFRHTENIEEIIEQFTRDRYPGSQVQKLSFDITKMSSPLLVQLPTIFPNITQVTTQRSMNYKRVQIQDDYSNWPLFHWRDTLETFSSMSDWSEAVPILRTTTFPRLTSLVLDHPFRFTDKEDGFDTPYFLQHIRNAPSLKRLRLETCAIDLEFLETVHDSCPHLHTLLLVNTQIIIKNDTLVQPLIPAGVMSFLRITNPACFDTNGLFLEYITAKYRNLKDLQLVFNIATYHPTGFNLYHRRFTVVAANDDEDSDIVVNDVNNPKMQGITAEYIDLYRSLKKDYEVTLAVYKQSGSKFYSNLTTSIESINIDIDPFENTIESLAVTDTKLADLVYYDLLEDPAQLKHISHIKYLKSLRITINFVAQMNMGIFPSVSVTKLDFSSLGHNVHFDWLLLTFPSLQKLSIFQGEWTVSGQGDYVAQFTGLSKFRIMMGLFDQNSIDFLTTTAPNIQVFELYTYKPSPATHDINIDISGWDLQELGLGCHSININGISYFNIKTPYLDEMVEYNYKKKSVALVEGGVQSFGDAKPQMFTITSNVDKQFKFLNYGLSLTQSEITLTLPNQ